MSDAAAIYQAWLDRVAAALWNGDHARVAASMAYPHVMATEDGAVHFETPEKLAEASAEFRTTLTRMGAQAYHRICTDAAFSATDRIDGRHMTYILRGGTYVVPPFANKMTLVQQDGGAWLGAGIAR